MADLTRKMNEIIGTYKGNDVKMIEKFVYDESSNPDKNLIYAVYDKPANTIVLVKNNQIIGEMTKDGDVSDYRTVKPYKKARAQKKEKKEEVKEVSSTFGEMDVDAFIKEALEVDLLAGWAERMGVDSTALG